MKLDCLRKRFLGVIPASRTKYMCLSPIFMGLNKTNPWRSNNKRGPTPF